MKNLVAGLAFALAITAAGAETQAKIPSFVHPGTTVVYEGLGAKTIVPIVITVTSVSATTVTGTTALQAPPGEPGINYSWTCTTGTTCQVSPSQYQGEPSQFWVDPENPLPSITPSITGTCGEPWTAINGSLPFFDPYNLATYSTGHLSYKNASNGASCGVIYDQATGIIVDFDQQLPTSSFQIALFSKIGGFLPALSGNTDFAGNGKSDILWQNENGQVAIWLMNGTTVTGTPLVCPNPGPDWQIVGIGDFNGDGKPDILIQSVEGIGGISGKLAQIWLMNGTTPASVLDLPEVLQGYNVVGVADFNHDGKSDIVWQNVADGQLVIWLINGTATPQQISINLIPGQHWHVVGLGDFTGTG